ncbi:DMT family transporter [Acinetobacter baumannii]|uniref:DMT family transporter n=1 Tax=Acinetobacter baumannii TaxID=470 RepID=UPI00244A79B4|nr:DMT family transporter [Acinetobacter baumannii]MDH2626090.1 DMT family transporter [Acinetobacter baumannii]
MRILSDMSKSIKAIFFVVIAVLCLAFHDLLGKKLNQNYSIILILWFRYLFHFLFATFHSIKIKKLSRFKRIHFLRALLMSLIGLSFITGLKYIPLSEATAINFLAPIFVLIFSFFILKEKVNQDDLIKIVIGFFGILIIARPGGDIFKIEIIFPMCAALFFAFYQVLTKITSMYESSLISNYYLGFYAFFLTSLALPFFWEKIAPNDLIFFLLVGVFGTFAHTLFNKAYVLESPVKLAPYSYMQILFATLLGFIFFGAVPDLTTFLGIFIIFCSGLNIRLHKKEQ